MENPWNDEIPARSGGGAAGDAGITATVVQPAADDVLLGRGLPAVQFSGNIRFRLLCNERQASYFSVQRHARKDEIARSVVLEVRRRGGRFLRRNSAGNITSENAEETACWSDTGWMEVDDELAIEKVKQTMRDNKRKSTTSSDVSLPDMELPAPRAPASPPAQQQQQPAARLPQHLLPERGAASARFSFPGDWGRNPNEASFVRNGYNPIGIGEMPDQTSHFTPEQRDRRASFPLSSNPQQFLPGYPLQLQDRQELVDVARLLELQHGLAQRAATGIDPWRSLLLSQQSYPNLNHDEPQQGPSDSFALFRKLQSLSPDQRASLLSEIPRAYLDLLPLFVADARQNSRLTPLTLTDVLRLRQARHFALQRGDFLRVAQVDHIEQTMQLITNNAAAAAASTITQATHAASLPSALSSGGDDIRSAAFRWQQQQQQELPRATAGHIPTNDEESSTSSAGTERLDHRKPAARANGAAAARRSSNASSAVTPNNNNNTRTPRPPTENADLPLKKRARRDS